MSSNLCRIRTRVERVAPDVVAAYQGIPSSVASDALRKLGVLRGVRPIPYPGLSLAGPAITVYTRAQDNVLAHKAMDLAQPGDVIVIAAGGYPDCGIIGELMARYAMSRGVAGFVIDGMVRDSEFFAQARFPVYALGTSPRGPHRTAEGEINYPVTCAGVGVNPGDLVVGDADGVTVIPREAAGEILERCRDIMEHEKESIEAIRAGTSDRRWIDKLLEERRAEMN